MQLKKKKKLTESIIVSTQTFLLLLPTKTKQRSEFRKGPGQENLEFAEAWWCDRRKGELKGL